MANKPFADVSEKLDLMMDDNEEIRDFKQWWHKHGKQWVMAGLVAIATYFAWVTWQDYQTRITENRSSTYQALLTADQQGQFAQLVTEARKFARENEGSIYADGVRFLLAKYELAKKNYQEAQAELDKIIASATTPLMVNQAYLAKIRYYLEAKKPDQALATAAKAQILPPFKAELAYLQGVAYLDQGKKAEAKKALDAALADKNLPQELKPLVQLLVDDLS